MKPFIHFTYQKLLKPALFAFEPEKAHRIAIGLLKSVSRHPGILDILQQIYAVRKPVTLFDLTFPNPLGLAAGFDKDAEALPAWEALGFGFVEIGTVTAEAQTGNASPRLFRYPDKGALINRLGFNNEGSVAIAARLRRYQSTGVWPKIPVGANIGKSKNTSLENALDDYLTSFHHLEPYVDYIALNVSSPNTPDLRKLQERDALEHLLRGIQAANAKLASPKPLLLKIAPDLAWEQIEEIISVATAEKLSGLIATNTTIDHSTLGETTSQEGGLSGIPLEGRATSIVDFIRRRTDLPIIGVGGIHDVESARRKLDMGANLIQLYTSYVYQGPSITSEIVSGLG